MINYIMLICGTTFGVSISSLVDTEVLENALDVSTN